MRFPRTTTIVPRRKFDMRAKLYSFTEGDGVAYITLACSMVKSNILKATESTEFDIYVAEKYDIDIPITPQLLEANGITLVEVGDNGPSTPAKYRSRFEKWRISTKWKDINLWYDRTAKYWHIQGMEAAHLHTSKQLQKALYMADIPLELNCRI